MEESILELSPDLVRTYVSAKLQLDDMRKRCDILNESIKNIMLNDNINVYDDSGSEYKLSMSSYKKSTVDWKEVSMDLIIKLYGERYKEALNAIYEMYPEKDICSLHYGLNGNFNKNSSC